MTHRFRNKEKRSFSDLIQKHNALARVIILVVLVSAIIITATILANPRVRGEPQACFKADQSRCVKLIGIADTEESRKVGLSKYDHLAPNTGLLFVFERERTSTFWMKDMSFPIDIIWLNSGKRVVHIVKDAPPCEDDNCELYNCLYTSKYVVEVPAGWSDEYNIYVGDPVTFLNTKY